MSFVGETFIGGSAIGVSSGSAAIVLENLTVIEARFDFTCDKKWRTHERVFWEWEYADDGLPDPVMPLFGLLGAMESTKDPAIRLDLTPYLNWQPDSVLRLDIPAGILSTFAAGRYSYEILTSSSATDHQVTIAGCIDLALSLHRDL